MKGNDPAITELPNNRASSLTAYRSLAFRPTKGVRPRDRAFSGLPVIRIFDLAHRSQAFGPERGCKAKGPCFYHQSALHLQPFLGNWSEPADINRRAQRLIAITPLLSRTNRLRRSKTADHWLPVTSRTIADSCTHNNGLISLATAPKPIFDKGLRR